jgi:hypothetical protein
MHEDDLTSKCISTAAGMPDSIKTPSNVTSKRRDRLTPSNMELTESEPQIIFLCASLRGILNCCEHLTFHREFVCAWP